MIGERQVTIGFYDVTARPALKLRRALFDILPYWQGAKPKFEIIFEARTDIDHQSNYLCAIQFSNNQLSKPLWEVLIPKLKEKEERKYTVGDMPLFFTGDTFLIVAEKPSKEKGAVPHYESVYMFNVTNRSWLALTLLAGILAGGLAALGNWIINLIS